MTIKKLTVAAAIAVGIASCSFTSAMAACPCSSAPACPSQLPVVTGAPCEKGAILPVMTGAACPVSSPCSKCNETPPPPCDCNPAPACGCAEPVSAICPSTSSCANLDMKQVYAYPNAIYGTNNYVGESSNSVYSTHTAWSYDGNSGLASLPGVSGVTVSSEGQMTGAAACLPCSDSINGVAVNRNGARLNDCDCDKIKIQTSNSIDALKKSFIPFDAGMTGAAAPLMGAFPDVPDSYWAACPIDRLAINNVVVGYPDKYFRPGIDVSRAEFATMLVKGMNLTCDMSTSTMFKDVPKRHWANSAITKAVSEGLMAGHPNGMFKPKSSVTRAEALTALSKGIKCADIDSCKAKEILSQYCDGTTVPSWAEIPIAKALDSGVLKNSPNPTTINAGMNASRADIASMLQTVRVAQGYDTNPVTASDNCNTCATDKQAYMEREEIVKIPTLKLEFLDEINAKSSHVGQQFATTTLEDVTINGKLFPCGSLVRGKIVEVIRPSGCEKGALKLAFTSIENCDCKETLPKQILTAQLNKCKVQNPVSRFIAMPFTWAGSLVGIVGRTTGGMIANVGNAVEDVSGGFGIAMGETFQGQFKAAGRSLQDSGKSLVKAPVDFTRTALSGTMGLFQTTGDEVAFVVDPKGTKIAAVNPKEHITIAFGCSGD